MRLLAVLVLFLISSNTDRMCIVLTVCIRPNSPIIIGLVFTPNRNGNRKRDSSIKITINQAIIEVL